MLKSQVRNTNIEVLRFVLMCFIFFWHIIVHGYGFAEIGNDGFDYTASMWVTIPLCVLFVPATYCFVFISGFYGLHFSLRKLLQLVLWCISASVLSTLFCHLLWSDTISLHRLVCSLLPITTKSYWFITEYVLLFIISPFLNFGCERLTKRELRAVLALLFIYDAIKLVLLKANVGSDIVGFMFIYILGRYIHQHGVNFAKMGG